MASLRHFFRVLLGVGLILLGIAGLILPIMPGWVFLIPGLLILADYFPPIRRLVDFIKARFHDAEAAYQKARSRQSTAHGEAEGQPDGAASECSTKADPPTG